MKKVKHEDHRPDPTPDRQLKSRSGWCSDNDHSGCRRFFSFGICGCDCDHPNEKVWKE